MRISTKTIVNLLTFAVNVLTAARDFVEKQQLATQQVEVIEAE